MELQLIYEDFSEGYVDSQEDLMDIVTVGVLVQEDLMDIVTVGVLVALLIVLFMWFTGTGDTAL